MGSTFEHTKLVDDIHLAVGQLSFARCWKNATGAARSFDNPDRVISFGLEGSGDLGGFFMGGQSFFIECKTGNATQSKEQINFEAMCKRFGVHYFLVKSVQQALQQVIEAAKTMQVWRE